MSGSEDDEVAEQFNLQDWCKAAGLTRKTEGTLSKEELTSLDALKMLEPVDLREMGLPIGQRKLLQQAVASLRTDQDRVPGGVRDDIRAGVPETDEAGGASMRDHGDQEANAGLLAASSSGMTIEDIRRQAAALGSAGKTFDELFSPPPHTAQVSHNPTPMVALAAASMPPLSAPPQPQLPGISHSDLRTILTIKSGSQKVVHITQFLAESTKKRLRSNRRGIVLGAGGGECTDPHWGRTSLQWNFNQRVGSGEFASYGASVADGGLNQGSHWILPGIHHANLWVRGYIRLRGCVGLGFHVQGAPGHLRLHVGPHTPQHAHVPGQPTLPTLSALQTHVLEVSTPQIATAWASQQIPKQWRRMSAV